MDKENSAVPTSANLTGKVWETPTFDRYDARRETQAKYATVIEFTTTTGPAS